MWRKLFFDSPELQAVGADLIEFLEDGVIGPTLDDEEHARRLCAAVIAGAEETLAHLLRDDERRGSATASVRPQSSPSPGT